MNRTIALIALAGLPVACGDPAGPREWDPIEIAAPDIQGDTVDAILPQAVVVTVRMPDGQPVPNVHLAFRTTNGYVTGTAGGPDWLEAWHSRTDSHGRAAIRFRLGNSTTQPARLTVQTGLDEAMFELDVHPGAPVGVRAFPAETALAVTDTYTPAVRMVDRHGNPRPGRITATLSSRQPGVARVAGGDLTVLTPGKAIIDWTADGVAGTAVVYGMPPGRLALTSHHSALDAFDMGTASLRHIADERSGCVSWHPDGERMLLANLIVVRLSGEAARISTGSDSIIAGCGEFTADGAWIYFEGRRPTEGNWVSHIWRVRPDGTQLEQITDGGGYLPSPSPDGARVAYMHHGVSGNATVNYVVTRTVASSALDTISPPIPFCESDAVCAGGITAVRWSPTGEWIAYATKSEALRGGGPYVGLTRYGSLVRLVRPDGSATRYIGPPGSEPHHHGFSGDVNWSPDGEWLVGPSFRDGGRIRLVQLASGEEVLLNSSSAGFVSSAWTSH